MPKIVYPELIALLVAPCDKKCRGVRFEFWPQRRDLNPFLSLTHVNYEFYQQAIGLVVMEWIYAFSTRVRYSLGGVSFEGVNFTQYEPHLRRTYESTDLEPSDNQKKKIGVKYIKKNCLFILTFLWAHGFDPVSNFSKFHYSPSILMIKHQILLVYFTPIIRVQTQFVDERHIFFLQIF